MNSATTFITCIVSVIYIGKYVCEARILDAYIRHYETLNYDINDLHSRHRRAVDGDEYLRFNIHAHGRKFRLKLERDDSIFMAGHYLEFKGAKHKVDTSSMYTGVLIDDPGSHVHGSVIRGTFRGEIRLHDGGTFYVENSDHYFSRNETFHSVIYSLKDVKLDPYKHLREAEGSPHSGLCGLDAIHHRMRETAASLRQKKYTSTRSPTFMADLYEKSKYSEEANNPRSKRAVTNCGFPGNKNTCSLYLRSDPILMETYTDKNGRYKYTEEQAKDEIMDIFRSHLKAVNHIYGKTKFITSSGTEKCYLGVQFRVLRTKIMTVESERCSSSSPSEFCNKHLDVSNFLNLNSEDNHSLYCLAYVFTRRDFAKGTLGLAWVAGTDGTNGGICEKYEKVEIPGAGSSKSLNTGVITFVNYQKRVPPRVSHLTFAHEIGHNFGSPHDSGSLCAPFGTTQPNANEGNYIMFASATQGDNVNNNAFSPCSMDNITRIIDYVVNSDKNCFKVSKEAFCGNGIVEGKEQCDCGFDESECKRRNDSCCWPKGVKGKECRLKVGKACSPSQGPCCNSDCEYMKAGSPTMTANLCKAATECSNASYCNGGNATCPTPVFLPDRSLCDNNHMTCSKGLCQASVCEAIMWKQCFMEAKTSDKSYRDKLCYVACYSNITHKCISSNDKTAMDNNPNFKKLIRDVNKDQSTKAVKLPPGSPCNKYQGYCDVFSKCRNVDAKGPLSRLKSLLFSEATLSTIRAWIQTHWWAVLLMSVGVVIFMGLFIAVCAVHTPSSNPRKSPARKLTDTLRRRRNREGQAQTSRTGAAPSAAPRQGNYSNSAAAGGALVASEPSDPPPPYYYPSPPSGIGPAPGARAHKQRPQHGIEMKRV